MNDWPKWMNFNDDPAETVVLIEQGETFSEYNLDELLPVVGDLLRANRSDLALPFFKRIYEAVDEMITWMIVHNHGTPHD